MTVDSNNTTYTSRDSEDQECNAIIKDNTLYFGCQNTRIPDGIVTIYNNAFYDQTYLISINIPDSVTTIGSSAFYNCRLSSLPDGIKMNNVTTIGSYAFYGTRLPKIDISDTIRTLSSHCLYSSYLTYVCIRAINPPSYST